MYRDEEDERSRRRWSAAAGATTTTTTTTTTTRRNRQSNNNNEDDRWVANSMDAVAIGRFVDVLLNNISLGRERGRCRRSAADEGGGCGDVFGCGYCTAGVVHEPVTLPCGHTFCKRCVVADFHRKCKRCGARFGVGGVYSLPKVNVVIGSLLDKWCASGTKVARCRQEANELGRLRRWEEAARQFNEALEIAPKDHLVHSSLSRLLLQLGQVEEALWHAERCVQLKQDWSEGYYRMAVALQVLGRYEDSIIAYLQSLALDPDIGFVRIELTKLLHKTLNANMRRHSLDRKYAPYPMIPRSCHSSPGSSAHNSDDSDHSSYNDGQHKTYRKIQKRRPQFLSCNISPEKVFIDDKISLFPLIDTPQLKRLVDRCLKEMKKIRRSSNSASLLMIDSKAIDRTDFECTLCFRMFWQPVTTPCGHMFCRMCLDRCLDHNPVCPLCKTSLQDYLAERRQSITEFIECVMQQFLPLEYSERQRIHEEEMSELASAGIDAQHEVPIFVCTMAFPTVPCPLHVFEPRYRLMIRQCVESGTRQFGMCPCLNDSDSGFANYGTMVEIREVQYFPDGRAIADTVGNRRFKVVRKGMRDGYNTALVEFLTDVPIDADEANELGFLHDTVHEAVLHWFAGLQEDVRQQILKHFGAMPELEADWLALANGPAWCWWVLAILPLDKRAQLAILAMTSLRRRLEALQRVLNYLQRSSVI